MEDLVIVGSVVAQTVLMSAFVNRKFGRKNRKNGNRPFSGAAEH